MAPAPDTPTAPGVPERGAPVAGDAQEPPVPRRVLSIHAHPDDQEFTVGGTLAKWARAGSVITTICLTRGGAGSNEHSPPTLTREVLIPIREAEQRAAARLLGVAEVIFLPPSGLDTLLSRADLIETADGFKCLEYNVSANVGGWQTTVITGLQLATPPVSGFLAREGIEPTFTDTVVEMFRHMVEDLRRKDVLRGRGFTLAFVVDPAERPEAERLLGFLRRELRRTLRVMELDLDGRLAACTYDELAEGFRSLIDNYVATHYAQRSR